MTPLRRCQAKLQFIEHAVEAYALRQQGWSEADLARLYEVSKNQVRDWCNREKWRLYGARERAEARQRHAELAERSRAAERHKFSLAERKGHMAELADGWVPPGGDCE